jgi:hypothetical protein
MVIIMTIEITTTAKSVSTNSAIGVPTTIALIVIVLAAIVFNAAWIIILEIITAGKQCTTNRRITQKLSTKKAMENGRAARYFMAFFVQPETKCINGAPKLHYC